MGNYIFSYDLNGSHPTHAEMDKHIKASPWANGRILETVWYIGADAELSEVTTYVTRNLSDNDRYIVIDAALMEFENLLVNKESLLAEWSLHG